MERKLFQVSWSRIVFLATHCKSSSHATAPSSQATAPLQSTFPRHFPTANHLPTPLPHCKSSSHATSPLQIIFPRHCPTANHLPTPLPHCKSSSHATAPLQIIFRVLQPHLPGPVHGDHPRLACHQDSLRGSGLAVVSSHSTNKRAVHYKHLPFILILYSAKKTTTKN